MKDASQDAADAIAFKALKGICEERVLRLAYCPTYVRPELQKKAMMVCFTDAGLQESSRICDRFGRVGIAFRKDRLMGYGANPVLYTTSQHVGRAKHVSDLLGAMLELEKDREWRETHRPYPFSSDQTEALLGISTLLQEYDYKGEMRPDGINYEQREWRLTFHTLPFAGGDSEQKPGMACFYKRDGKSYPTIAFAPSDVVFLVVPRRFEPEAQVLAGSLGCAVRIYESDVLRADA